MELMDKSLTSLLDDSDTTLPFHIQVNICHDIALALSYLHSNEIVHRDLSSNNILMTGDRQAKVTDFGMARLFSRGDLTSNPGTGAYMPPEAKESCYSKRIDCFSYGVLIIQTITLLYPKPGDKYVPVQGGNNLHEKVSEVQRCHNHIELVEPDHPLLPLALECLKEEETERPSARELCVQLEETRNSKHYLDSKKDHDLVRKNAQLRESIEATQHKHAEEIAGLRQCHSKEIQVLTEQKEKEIQNLQESHTNRLSEIEQTYKLKITHLQEVLKSLDEAMKFQQHAHQHDLMEMKQSRILELKAVEEDKEDWRQRHSLASHELRMKQEEVLKLQKQVRDLRAASDHHPAQDMRVTAVTDKRPGILINWKPNETPAPQPVYRKDSEAVFCNETLYMRSGSHRNVFAFKPRLGLWRKMPQCPHHHSTLTHIDKTVLAIGGKSDSLSSLTYMNTIFYLTDDGGEYRWQEADFCLRTKRCSVMAVNTGTLLVVAGGEGEGLRLKKVEVMDINPRPTGTWQVVADLPEALIFSSSFFSNGQIYFLGGEMGYNGVEKNVMITCLLHQLLMSRVKTLHKRRGADPPPTNIWSKTLGPPVTQSAYVVYQGQILSIGGKGEDSKPTSAVYGFDADTNSWSLVSCMRTTRSKSFAVVLPEDSEEGSVSGRSKLVVVGGNTTAGRTDTVETGTLFLETFSMLGEE